MQPGEATPSVQDDASVQERLADALPVVYDYLLARCHARGLAEDLTSETFVAAAVACRQRGTQPEVPWLIGVARHKLADHWRRQAREDRRLAAVAGETTDVSWDGPIDTGRAEETLALLNPAQRAALTLRYVDGLPVAEVAELVGRSLHATETLLMRSKAAFRRFYAETDGGDR